MKILDNQEHLSAFLRVAEPAREALGHCPDGPCSEIPEATKHPEWRL